MHDEQKKGILKLKRKVYCIAIRLVILC